MFPPDVTITKGRFMDFLRGGVGTPRPHNGVLFGDAPLDQWVPADSSEEPWKSFASALYFVRANQVPQAEAWLRYIIAMPGLEPRHYLEAWNALRALGVDTGADAPDVVLGVVVEVTLPGGTDLLVAYADGSARYFNHGGSIVVWDRPDTSLDGEITACMAAAADLARHIGLHDDVRRDIPPAHDSLRVTVLTPAGLKFGEGPIEAIASDNVGGPVFTAMTQLMAQLTKLASAA